MNRTGFFLNLLRVPTGALVMATSLLWSSVSFAGAPAPGPELQKWHEVQRFDVKTPWAEMPAGAARGNAAAPLAVVRSVVLDYKNYASFISRFEKSRVVGRSGNRTDVYLEVPILKGAAKVWAIVRFEPPKQVDDEEVIEGHMVKGNVKRLDAVWRLKKLDDSTTQLQLELLIVPDLPVPDSLVVPEVRYAAAKAVEGSRNEAEKRTPH